MTEFGIHFTEGQGIYQSRMISGCFLDLRAINILLTKVDYDYHVLGLKGLYTGIRRRVPQVWRRYHLSGNPR